MLSHKPALHQRIKTPLLRGCHNKTYPSPHTNPHLHPRQSCYVAWEGLRGGRFWAFSVLDSGGSVLARMAAPARPNAERWLAALEAAGCVRDDGLVPAAGPKARAGSHVSACVGWAGACGVRVVSALRWEGHCGCLRGRGWLRVRVQGSDCRDGGLKVEIGDHKRVLVLQRLSSMQGWSAS